MKKVFALLLLTAAIVGFVIWSLGVGAKSAEEEKENTLSTTPVKILPPDPRPNIVVVNLDDADHQMLSPQMLELYPGFKELAQRSIRFTNLHVTTPFCGPSRASLFRGQYAHRTGVRVNIPESYISMRFKGGYSEFMRQGHDHDELGVWLKNGGYRTMFMGKYHHNGFDNRKPDGFDDFYATNGGRYHGAFEFTTRDNPKGRPKGNGEDVYRTDREADDAVAIVQQHAKRRKLQTSSGEVAQPFFFYYAPLAPHRPLGHDFTKMVNKEKYGEWQPDLEIPMTPDFNEPDMFDKPLLRQSSSYTEQEIEELHEEYRCRARALKSVDDYMVKLIASLKETGQYENTYFLITSDNGYQLGHHRLHNKLDPYRMSTTAPLLVCGPEVKEKTSASHLLAHIDLCPTILDLAKCPKPEFLDGKSFVEVLRNPSSHDEATWREPVLLENWQVKRNRRTFLPGAYSGLRYHDRLYIEWVTGDREYYDLSTDPYELENSYDSLSNEDKEKLREDLFATRAVEMNPIITVMHRPVLSAERSFPYCARGMAEDDRCVDKIELMIRHMTRGYWNGKSWQKRRTRVLVEDYAKDQQIVSWRYDLREPLSLLNNDETEIVNERKIYRVVLQAFAWDHKGNQSEEARTQLLVPYADDPYAVRTQTAGTPAYLK